MVIAVIVSLLSGLTVVLSRTVNAALSKKAGPIVSTVWNYITGFFCSTALFLVVRGVQGSPALPAAIPPLWLFTGGMVGVVVVFLLNISVKKISSFYMTLFMFIGQVFTGVVLDIVLTGEFSPGNLLGGLAVTVGLAYNLYVDRAQEKQAAAKTKDLSHEQQAED